MKPDVDIKEGTGSPLGSAHQLTSNNKWGDPQSRTPKDLSRWQQGYMSRQEVSGEATTSAASEQTANPSEKKPNYKIPKKSNLESNRLNQLASNISPPAKERKEGNQISGTRQREGRSKK